MKSFLLTLTVLISLVSCTGGGDSTAENVQLIEDYVNAVEQLDHELMETYLADDYIGYGPSFNDSISKSEASANWRRNVENLYENVAYKRSRTIAVTVPDGPNKGEWVSNWAELAISYKENKDQVRILANTIYMIEGGKIKKSYTFYNEADALEQLGYVFINPDNL